MHPDSQERERIAGQGVLDYDTYLKHIAALPFDCMCYCEQRPDEMDDVMNFVNLHDLAEHNRLRLNRRGE